MRPAARAALALLLPASAALFGQSAAIVKLECGLKSQEPRVWTGSVSVPGGKVHSAWGWHYSAPDRIEGSSGFHFQTRLYRPPEAPNKPQVDLPHGVSLLPNGVYVSLEAPAGAAVSVQTNHGEFSFPLAELISAGRLPFLGGDVHAVYTPAVESLTRGEASQHDFPAAAAVGDDLYVAWTTYHNEANTLYLGRRRDKAWTTYRVTPRWSDYYGTALAAGGDGLLHVIFSEYDGGRWRLVDRVFDPRSETWQRERYLAPGAARQMFPQAATDAAGRPWVTWQEFGDGNLEVMASYYDGGRWVAPIGISEQAANNWAPAIAAAPDGSVWIAWDSYESGNYDIYLRPLRRLRPEPAIRVTRAPTRDAYPSVAVDSANRVWLAWAESGANWAKDWGVLGRPGTLIRDDSRIRLARYASGRWTEPTKALEETMPRWMADRHEYPRLAMGPNDVPYLFFRKTKHRLAIAEHELNLKFGSAERRLQPWYDTVRGMSSIQMTGFNGAAWLPVRELPWSEGGAFAQAGIARQGARLVFVWPSDGRTYLDPHFRTSQLRYMDFGPKDSPAAGGMKAFALEAGGAPDAAPTEARDLARVRSARWEDREPLRLFRGDLHRHTDLSADSERDGDILEAYRYALDAASLDFLAVTDHSGAERMHFYKYQWWRTRQLATMFNRPGRFATFFGYERTVTFPGGHRNIISARRDAQPVPISDEEFTGAESWAERLYPYLIANGDIAIAHTTAGGGGTDWRDNDPRAEPVVEIFQGLRGSYEEPDSPGKAPGGAAYSAGYVWNAWSKGHKMGLIANSDHQSTHQSYACVYAPELTAEAILGGIRQRRTFAATDNMVLRLEALAADGSAAKMGDEIKAAWPPQLQVHIEGTDDLKSVELIRNGQVIYAQQPGRPSVEFSFRDNNPLEAEAYYHVRLVQKNKQIAWSSPIWLRQ